MKMNKKMRMETEMKMNVILGMELKKESGIVNDNEQGNEHEIEMKNER